MSGDWIATIAAAVSALAAAAAAVFALFQVRSANHASQAAVFLEIYKGWNEIYPEYRRMLSDDLDIPALIAARTRFSDYACTADWQRMRRVFAFHEFLGAIVREGLLSRHRVCAMVSVNDDFWLRYKPLIEYFREEAGKADLYIAWQELIERGSGHAGPAYLPAPAMRWPWRRRAA